jgi:anti-sigma factor RsiW
MRTARSQPLSCHEVRRMLQSVLDGEMPADRAELVAAHLESCRRCEIEAHTVRQVIAAIRRQRPDLDLAAVTRLTDVAERLAEER